ncbi:MAG: hypothetical protein RIQ93_1379 [Verrucomicrobiota bacterium]|jgi:hypothetical protein
MEAGLILNNDVQRGRLGVGDLLEEDRVDVPVDGRGKQKFARVGPVDFQRLVQIAPLVFVAYGASTRSRVGRRPADHRQQPVTMFVEHPQPHRLRPRRTHSLAQPRRQLHLEFGRSGRILFRVRFTRDFLFSAQSAQNLEGTADA